MAKKNVVSIGMEIPGADIKTLSMKSKSSLLDFDIIIIDPAIDDFYGYSYEDYQGKPCLDDTNSFRLKEHIEHWRREILEAVKAGKNVFLYLNEEEEVFIATGQKSYSGTGRNRQTTRHVVLASNYQIVPGGVETTNSNGSSMVLSGKNNELAPYWKELGPESEFRLLLDGEGLIPTVQTKNGAKTVGAKLRYKNADGNLFLMPYISFSDEKYTYENEEDDKIYWNEEACTLGKKIISAICALDKSIRSSGEVSAVPDWVFQDKYLLPKEEKIRDKLIAVESKIEKLQQQKERHEQDIADESILKRLIYENGKPLEAAVHLALKALGFDVSHYEDAESEFDVIFECKEGRLLGEVEGKDNKAISIDKLRQLEMNIHEDFSREDVTDMAKGALIGNAFRLQEPTERSDFFTEKCITAANRSGTALIRSDDLFNVARYLSGKSDKKYSAKCRSAILAAIGQVAFPPIPNSLDNAETIADAE
ncbi:hypothetical protein [Alteromonas lipotrueae]|uniref:hypothetical protein n=1 Tax=Alteromonas lipotrueae TaxID=2803814 RepID=UPI001C46D129|nr:hypothetical protein [Alteromonas lipotrueae]